MITALDTETTGIYAHHGCKPFYVSTLTETGTLRSWYWKVDPYTREPQIPEDELRSLREYIAPESVEYPFQCHLEPQSENPLLVFHNAKFDVRMLQTIGITLDWNKLHDTCILAHLINSGLPRGLKELALYYCNILDDDETDLRAAVLKARNIAKKYGNKTISTGKYTTTSKPWNLGGPECHHIPSPHLTPHITDPITLPLGETGGGKSERPDDDTSNIGFDYWLPKAVAEEEGYPSDHPWHTLLETYGDRDPYRTICLWKVLLDELGNLAETINPGLNLPRGQHIDPAHNPLWELYKIRRDQLSIRYEMENHGVSINLDRWQEKVDELQTKTSKLESNAQKAAPGLADWKATFRKNYGIRLSNLTEGNYARRVYEAHEKLNPARNEGRTLARAYFRQTITDLADFVESKNPKHKPRADKIRNIGTPLFSPEKVMRKLNLKSDPQIKTILFTDEGFNLEPTAYTDTGLPAADKDSLSELKDIVETSLPDLTGHKSLWDHVAEVSANTPKSGTAAESDSSEKILNGYKSLIFLENLTAHRKAIKASEYLESYHRFGLPFTHTSVENISTKSVASDQPKKVRKVGRLKKTIPTSSIPKTSSTSAANFISNWLRVHTSFNITGTNETRDSSNGPNLQNVSKKGEFNLRYVFGPPPGKVWLCIDYDNIEMRIFAYSCGDQKLISAFEQGKSMHMVIAWQLWEPLLIQLCNQHHQQLHNQHIRQLAAVNAQTVEQYFPPESIEAAVFDFQENYPQYGWTKNGNFSLIYGASKRRADNTYHRKGAYNLIRGGMPYIDSFMKEKFSEAESTGRVITLGGYPLSVPTSEPHKAVNYFVQGTAGIAMNYAMSRCKEYMRTHLVSGNLNSADIREFHQVKLLMLIHDELVFELPDCVDDQALHSIAKGLKDTMETASEFVGVPLPASCKLVRSNWAEGSKLTI